MAFWDFISDHASDIIGGALDIGGGLLQNHNASSYTDALKAREQRNWEDGKAYDEAYRQWLGQSAAASASNRAAANRAAMAKAAAARQQEANRQAAALKGDKIEGKFFRRAMGELEPYKAAGARAIGPATDSYMQGLGNLGLLAGYVMSPGQLGKLEQSVPAYNIPIGLSKKMAGG